MSEPSEIVDVVVHLSRRSGGGEAPPMKRLRRGGARAGSAPLALEASDLAPVTAGLPARFLGRFSLPALCAEMDQAGVLPALRTRGYDPSVRIEEEEGEHRLLVTSSNGAEVLIDLRMTEEALPVTAPALRSHGIEVLSVLTVEWLSLQDPRAVFTRERPRLPGQTHPGLGLGRQLYLRVLGWAAAWGRTASSTCPRSSTTRSSTRRPSLPGRGRAGRFEGPLPRSRGPPVADASAALEAGRVVDDGRQPVTWSPGDMLAALSPPVREYLARQYRAAVAAARKPSIPRRERLNYLFSPRSRRRDRGRARPEL